MMTVAAAEDGTATIDRSEAMPGFPPGIASEIVRFLRLGGTGNFQVTVKDGRITGCHITRFIGVKPGNLDGCPAGPQDSET